MTPTFTTIVVVDRALANVGSEFVTVIENEYDVVAKKLLVSSTDSIVVVTSEKLASGGLIVAMKVGGFGLYVGAMTTQLSEGVSDNFTSDGVSS
jgi:hypothetical protein